MNSSTAEHAGLRSNSITSTESKHSPLRKLDMCSRSELCEMRDRNEQLLNDRSVVNTLPDKGDRLRQTNAHIDELLMEKNDDEILSENHNSQLTRQLQDMSILTPRQNARKRSVDLANAQARSNDYVSDSLLRRSSRLHNSPPTAAVFMNSSPPEKAKVRMMTLAEAIDLEKQQNHHLQRDDAPRNTRRAPRSLAQSLSSTMTEMQLDPESHPLERQDDEEYLSDDIEEMRVSNSFFDDEFDNDPEVTQAYL
ncbi:uncharacterized protein BYT42DRAFT_548491 [Radiomyces spectabilis]|uniref:uncharacterized protein n=1 Tax=Radiomyces spectabilis TaxID=64574 RepID=UPI00221E588F|nr:uncharacterized protein BYT42DRAFT_548491 [Radiomyces spectabilis]KAI8371663.1 hypothetical protein BYT42DRAFT_548491 [Radiomyces spectabilis]